MEVGEEGDYIPIAEADSNRDPSAYQHNALPLGQSSPQRTETLNSVWRPTPHSTDPSADNFSHSIQRWCRAKGTRPEVCKPAGKQAECRTSCTWLSGRGLEGSVSVSPDFALLSVQTSGGPGDWGGGGGTEPPPPPPHHPPLPCPASTVVAGSPSSRGQSGPPRNVLTLNSYCTVAFDPHAVSIAVMIPVIYAAHHWSLPSVPHRARCCCAVLYGPHAVQRRCWLLCCTTLYFLPLRCTALRTPMLGGAADPYAIQFRWLTLRCTAMMIDFYALFDSCCTALRTPALYGAADPYAIQFRCLTPTSYRAADRLLHSIPFLLYIAANSYVTRCCWPLRCVISVTDP